MVLQSICGRGEKTIGTANCLASISSADLQFGGLIALAFLVLIGLAEWVFARFQVEVEWTRKLVHLGGGAVCLAIPFLIESHWVVLVLAVSMGLIFSLSRRWNLLRSIHSVARKSKGTEYYPLAVYLLFLLCAGQPWKFVICMLTLAVSDTVAALVGSRLGRIRFSIEAESKSLEGALAFFLATFVVVFVPLLIWNPLAIDGSDPLSPSWTVHYLLSACLIGLLVMCFELVSLQGRDNLFVPLGTWLVLTKTLMTDQADLVLQNVSFSGILLVLISVSILSNSFNIGGAIVVCLAAYGCWAMGSIDWAAPLFSGFAIYVLADLFTKLPWRITVRPATYMLIVPVIIMAMGNIFLNVDRKDLTDFCYGPFLCAGVVALAQAIQNVTLWKYRRNASRARIWAIVTGPACFLIIYWFAIFRQGIVDWQTLALNGLVAVSVARLSLRLIPTIPPRDAPPTWFRLRAALSLLAALLVALMQWMVWCSIWHPA